MQSFVVLYMMPEHMYVTYLYAGPGVSTRGQVMSGSTLEVLPAAGGVLSRTAGCRGITERGQEVPQSVWMWVCDGKGKGGQN